MHEHVGVWCATGFVITSTRVVSFPLSQLLFARHQHTFIQRQQREWVPDQVKDERWGRDVGGGALIQLI